MVKQTYLSFTFPVKWAQHNNLSHRIVVQGAKGAWKLIVLSSLAFFQVFEKLLKVAHFLTRKVHSNNETELK